MSHRPDYNPRDPNNHPEPPRPSRVYARLFDYDLNTWTVQPISQVFPTAKRAKSEVFFLRFDFPDAKYAYCQN